MRPLALMLALGLLVGSCGAKTGLRIPDAGHPDVGMDAGNDGGTDAGFDAPICMPGHFPLTPEMAELMLVIDRSASMRQTIAGDEGAPIDEWRWTLLRTALTDALGTLDPRVLVGAKFYPDPITVTNPSTEMACAAVTPIDVALGAGTRPAILSLFTSTDPNGGTPTAAALRSASMGFSSSSPRRFMLLATDGAPNCNPTLDRFSCTCTSPGIACTNDTGIPGAYSCLDDTRTVETLAEIRDRGIPTYVVGIEGPSFADVLDAMAIAGGRPRSVPGERAFYSVRSAAQLRQALMDITSSISACGFTSPSIPMEGLPFAIAIDGVFVPEDPANGWWWVDRARGQLELRGAACTSARPGVLIEAVVDTCAR